MELKKKIKVTATVFIVLLVLLLSASYAWLALSLAPEITDIDTNVGANGSLEIALLSDTTYLDPLLIQTKIGDSAVEQDAMVSNLSWGNVIELNDERYGMGELSLHPARLSLSARESDGYYVDDNILNVAEFGIDGRISILTPETVSAVYQENHFTYYVSGQKYGVRAIGTISNLTSQQKALATARTRSQSYTAATSRTVKNVWRENGPDMLNLLRKRYAENQELYSAEDVYVIQAIAKRMQEALEYGELALRQGIIGIAASQIKNESDFVMLQSMIENTAIPLSLIMETSTYPIPDNVKQWAGRMEEMRAEAKAVLIECNKLTERISWSQIEPLLDVFVDADKIYLGEKNVSEKDALINVPDGTVLTATPDSGIMAEIAEYAGNYSVFFRWTEDCNIEVRTADSTENAHLLYIVDTLKNSTAASGGWTRANLNDTYGYAMDFAFRCNMDTNLLLQTASKSRVAGNDDHAQIQGGGSYMRFTSEEMDTDQLLRLMDCIRIGFLDDRNTLIGLAKLNVSNFEVREDGVFAPLYLYEYMLEEGGILSVGTRRSEESVITPMTKNTPTVITAVVWLDGDCVNNSMVGYLSEQSMSGVLNLQFASSADLRVSGISVDNK